jgi:hypothetical protein
MVLCIIHSKYSKLHTITKIICLPQSGPLHFHLRKALQYERGKVPRLHRVQGTPHPSLHAPKLFYQQLTPCVPALECLRHTPGQAVSAEEFENDVWSGALVEPPFDPSVRTHPQKRERGEETETAVPQQHGKPGPSHGPPFPTQSSAAERLGSGPLVPGRYRRCASGRAVAQRCRRPPGGVAAGQGPV